MNRRLLITTLLLGAWTASSGFGQPPPDLPGPPGPPPMDEAPPPPEGPLGTWLERLEQENPEEFARLQALRQSDPEAFERELQRRVRGLRQRRIAALMEEFPRLAELVQQLPPEERDALLKMRGRMRPHEGGRRGPRGHAEDPGRPLQRDINALARRYREAPEAERPALRESLHTLLAEAFEAQEAQRRRHLEQAEQRLIRLKEMVEFREANRDTIIERRLRELTEGDPMAF